ncbi:hypothetical protein GCM10011348_17160 [Marinobacterium nitratireducens]|uniref:Phosphatidylinositol diacylglycerol-lyase n=1 Tax=Marinobacterium nitratireducens TaxID=518897 RepID=A0A918DQV7_9GAMM|nr:hypothetical protein [Marinobacterium nitratireducens]GGO80457.1 hypothetical protein GCM10011348_17160 [Marinobacterium nitratireducens]
MTRTYFSKLVLVFSLTILGLAGTSTVQAGECKTDQYKHPNNICYRPATWMRDLSPIIGDRRLTDIRIPGSHDAGTFDMPWGSIPKTQSHNFFDQLSVGARFFDIRPYYKNIDEGFVIHHGIAVAWATPLNSILADIKRFVSMPEHQRELVILQVDTPPDANDPMIIRLHQDLAKAFGERLLITNKDMAEALMPDGSRKFYGCNKSYPVETPSACSYNQLIAKGNILIFIPDWKQKNTAIKGALVHTPGIWSKDRAFSRRIYTETSNHNEHFKKLDEAVSGLVRQATDKLRVVYTQRMPAFGTKNPEGMAKDDNQIIADRIYSAKWRSRAINIVASDFVNGLPNYSYNVMQPVIEMNRK